MNRKLGILSVLFFAMCIFIYTRSGSEDVSKQPIKDYFEHIEGYKVIRHVELEESVLKLLKLDDYLYADYQGPNGKITLYIGYYYTADKASAAHSPLICYPSQGWKIEKQLSDLLIDASPTAIHYNEIITSLNTQKELVVYWFQASQDTNTQAFKNKTNVAFNKLTNKGEQHAFVRVSIPLGGFSQEQAKQKVDDFIKAFYPHFIRFVDGSHP
jgi:EpsI family protein